MHRQSALESVIMGNSRLGIYIHVHLSVTMSVHVHEYISEISELEHEIRQGLVELPSLEQPDYEEYRNRLWQNVERLTTSKDVLMCHFKSHAYKSDHVYEKLGIIKSVIKALELLGKESDIKVVMKELEKSAFELYINILNNENRLKIVLNDQEHDFLNVLRFEKSILKLCIRYNCYCTKISQTVYAEDEYKEQLKNIETLITRYKIAIRKHISKIHG